ncbi:hypothetical protein [Syntrophobacter fumaroxidans]|uniref:Uncharacterized protein n=1 Tax=Syntrophobacter fumaroxidans (strain DSM 10017 / MPOB) TaxID=335543 RepID=A0LM44_SYNFM|nr:hypothetical protein [Syntrophobacter fumaroxidans]ABK18496.1 conserved hypothetical protein [Syntrophobacter fumaroxidans MPOB]
MIFHPTILALLAGSMLTCAMLVYSAFFGVRILRNWDITSGSEVQLEMERRTYLISTVMAYALGFQLLSLFLFLTAADHLATMFVGAMCAAGTLKVNDWGYPTLVFKVVNALLCGLWLIVNHADNSGYDYPLIKRKYALLLIVTLSVAVETVVQTAYFLGLDPDIITSCCGSLFTSGSETIAAGVLSLPELPVEIAYGAAVISTFASGLCFLFKEKGAYAFALTSGITFVVSILALITFISPYFYELPTHHCPFCILHGEYRYIGYPLYSAFLAGGVAGLGVGALMPFREVASLREILPRLLRRLTWTSLGAWLVSLAIVTWGIVFSNLK